MSMHKEHRQRLRDRFLKEGLDNFDELYVLELLLFYCIPRVDTNPIAHRLLQHFGSLTAVLEANPEELEKIDPRMQIHDFRMVKGKGHTNLIFDVVLPRAWIGKEKQVQKALENALTQRNQGKIYLVVTFDPESFKLD